MALGCFFLIFILAPAIKKDNQRIINNLMALKQHLDLHLVKPKNIMQPAYLTGTLQDFEVRLGYHNSIENSLIRITLPQHIAPLYIYPRLKINFSKSDICFDHPSIDQHYIFKSDNLKQHLELLNNPQIIELLHTLIPYFRSSNHMVFRGKYLYFVMPYHQVNTSKQKRFLKVMECMLALAANVQPHTTQK